MGTNEQLKHPIMPVSRHTAFYTQRVNQGPILPHTCIGSMGDYHLPPSSAGWLSSGWASTVPSIGWMPKVGRGVMTIPGDHPVLGCW